MNIYTAFAQVYDVFMDDVDRELWRDFIVKKLRAQKIENGLLCDLGCGTGIMTEMLAEKGFDMIGVDASADMLSIAKQRQFMRAAERGEASEPDILYLQQNMSELELYGTVRAIICVCDSVNYITDENELKKTFQLVNNYLDPGGIFIFDINTPAKYEEIGENTIAENRSEGSFIWENSYDAGQRLNEYDLTLFLPEEDGSFRKYEETHVQRAWSEEEIARALEEGGLKLLEKLDAYTDRPATEETQRICYIAQEQGKKREEQT